MKICPKCKKEHSSQGGWCKPCRNIDMKARLKKFKKEAVNMKGSRCAACGCTGLPSIYDFHHINPVTKNRKTKLSARTKMTPDAIIELKSCILLCSNCHRIAHDQKGY